MCVLPALSSLRGAGTVRDYSVHRILVKIIIKAFGGFWERVENALGHSQTHAFTHIQLFV